LAQIASGNPIPASVICILDPGTQLLLPFSLFDLFAFNPADRFETSALYIGVIAHNGCPRYVPYVMRQVPRISSFLPLRAFSATARPRSEVVLTTWCFFFYRFQRAYRQWREPV
jgi:hypothetical protein